MPGIEIKNSLSWHYVFSPGLRSAKPAHAQNNNSCNQRYLYQLIKRDPFLYIGKRNDAFAGKSFLELVKIS
jgi:hypothetical protein